MAGQIFMMTSQFQFCQDTMAGYFLRFNACTAYTVVALSSHYKPSYMYRRTSKIMLMAFNIHTEAQLLFSLVLL